MSNREKQRRIEDLRDLQSIDPDQFHASSEFTVEIVARVSGSETVLRFADPSLQVTIEFPWWDEPERELSGWILQDIPNGTVDQPYFDIDQCWRIAIWQVGSIVYIACGYSDEEDLYDTFLSVTDEKYREGWANAIASSKH